VFDRSERCTAVGILAGSQRGQLERIAVNLKTKHALAFDYTGAELSLRLSGQLL